VEIAERHIIKKLPRGHRVGLVMINGGDAPQPPGNSGDVVVCSAFCESVPVVIKGTIAPFSVLLKVA
jgi:hypothetical protein